MKRGGEMVFEKLFPLMSTVVSDDVAQHGNCLMILKCWPRWISRSSKLFRKLIKVLKSVQNNSKEQQTGEIIKHYEVTVRKLNFLSNTG